MATTITPSDLTVTITEAYTVNGVAYGNNITKTYIDNGEVDQRVMSVGTSGRIKLLSFTAADAAGNYVSADYKYFRITNLDDTNFVNLGFHNGTDTFWIKLSAGDSFLLMDNEMDAIASSTTFGAFANLVEINGEADTADVDVEFLMVTV